MCFYPTIYYSYPFKEEIILRLLYTFDKKDYDNSMERSTRSAVRAIIIKQGKIALIKSDKEGFYKFPGGGIEDGESNISALIREAREEGGLNIIPETIKAFGKIREIRKSTFYENTIFDHTSYYYFAEITDQISAQELDNYEKELGYRLIYMDLNEAYQVNYELGKKYHSTFIFREAKILELLTRHFASDNKCY